LDTPVVVVVRRAVAWSSGAALRRAGRDVTGLRRGVRSAAFGQSSPPHPHPVTQEARLPLLSGSAAVTRFRVTSRPEEPDFDRLPFAPILPASEARESIGFVPFEPDAPYLVGSQRWAFRVRVDRRKPEASAVRERLQQLVATELQTSGREFVGSKRRRELKELAEAELLVGATPRTKVIECVLDGKLLLVASTAKAYLGVVLELVRRVGIVAEYLTPWPAVGEFQDEGLSEIVETHEPGQSVRGCRCLKLMLEEPDVLLEPEAGSARLRTRQAKISLTGDVMGDVFAYLEAGAEILSAKLLIGDFRFAFDGLSWRVSGLRFERQRYEHWIEALDARLQRIGELFAWLDAAYARNEGRLVNAAFRAPQREAAAAAGEEAAELAGVAAVG
jgi:hypothetical protein